MTSEDLYCIGKPDWKPSAPEVKPESKAVTLGEAAHLQIVPADFVLNPEAKQSLAAFAYDANGNKIGPVEVEWSLAGVRPPEGLPPAPPAAPGAPAPTPPPPSAGGCRRRFRCRAAAAAAAAVVIVVVARRHSPEPLSLSLSPPRPKRRCSRP